LQYSLRAQWKALNLTFKQHIIPLHLHIEKNRTNKRYSGPFGKSHCVLIMADNTFKILLLGDTAA